MDNRRKMCLEIRKGQLSVSEASRLYGVTRPIVRKWLARADSEGLDRMAELSRAPHKVDRKTSGPLEKALLDLKKEFPEWGAKKLCVILARDHNLDLQVRTADRILKRHGFVKERPKTPDLIRFARPASNMLMQMDFKGAPKSLPHVPLSVLDDFSRMSPLFYPVPDKRGETVFEALWRMFEETGLPDEMLMDNGDCWGAGLFLSAFEAKLWRLGIKTTHGRPYHPETQGKVERFHQTALLEMGNNLLIPDITAAREACDVFRNRYNWIRPHEALRGAVPGSVYVRSPKTRPDKLPEAYVPEGAISRKVFDPGFFQFQKQRVSHRQRLKRTIYRVAR
jgi:transposase InsO family protein